MDPLSIIGSVAGIATAGASLVGILFETVETYRNAPKEIKTIARGIQDLSLVLEQLTQILSDAIDMHTRCLRKSVLATIKRIDDIHHEVSNLIHRGETSFGRVRWTFLLKGKMRDLVARIEAHKSTVQLVCTTLLLAMQQRRALSINELEFGISTRRRLRRQAENLVNAAHQSLRDLTERDRRNSSSEEANDEDHDDPTTAGTIPTSPSAATPTAHDTSKPEPGPDSFQDLPLSSRAEDTEQAALFLYNIVFSGTSTKAAQIDDADIDCGNSTALVIPNPNGTDIVVAGRPFAAQVVDTLLHDWTVLSDTEIEEVAEKDPSREYQYKPARRPSREQSRQRGRDPEGHHNHTPTPPENRALQHRASEVAEEARSILDNAVTTGEDGNHTKARRWKLDESALEMIAAWANDRWPKRGTKAHADGSEDATGRWKSKKSKRTPGRDSAPGRISKTTRVQRDAVAALILGAEDAFRLIRKEVKGCQGSKTRWVVNAANVGIPGQTA